MNIIEYIQNNRSAIIEALKSADASAYDNTHCEYRVYLDTESLEIITRCHTANSLDYTTNPALWHIATMCHHNFDIVWDLCLASISDAILAAEDGLGITIKCDENGNPVDAYGEELCGNNYSIIVRAARQAGIDDIDIRHWMDAVEGEAIESAINDAEMDWYYDDIVNDLIDDIKREEQK